MQKELKYQLELCICMYISYSKYNMFPYSIFVVELL